MTKRHGYALLAAILAVIVAISVAIYVGVAADDAEERPLTGGRSPHSSAAPASAGTWVGAWSASPVGAEPGTEVNGMAGHSVRNVVHVAVGGTAARITLSNLYGQQPLTITHASIAVAATANNAAAAAGTMRRLTFRGSPTVVVPAGQQVVSDAVRLLIPHDTDMLVTTYSPTPSGPITIHPQARQISYSAAGDRTEDASGAAYTGQTPLWRYVTALDVLSHESDGTVVVIGDSLTDGSTSSVGENRRWTDVLADRLREPRDTSDGPRYSVVNQGISGNRVLASGLGRPAENPSGLIRFHRDVLGRTNVRVVVVALGINDILRTPQQTDANKITAGLRALTRQAHARGLRVVGATLMPLQGHRGYRPYLEDTRQAVNAQIRSGKVYDAYVDFDKALRDPYNPRRLRSDYDSGDHLHPSDKGYERMAEILDLEDLKGAAPAQL
ncbi:SGNH/GDSL hydrolase family protein [Streptomyces sp. NBC_00878]|uniref:SGNH/GDSL hydrolase family protein n=1 Tax=Streptomyces sp. NBC_00878 TaxID=2975854 RepID=UPI002252ABC0|nr:SGNH/GDSL hydrolase family protein [Streptomyces sp. NBC_00878]MCX4908372.1 SGNH/GDSL hydrolase family protein [Streptomyces sp. NBC_00878]